MSQCLVLMRNGIQDVGHNSLSLSSFSIVELRLRDYKGNLLLLSNRSIVSVSTLQELGSQMMEFYSNTFGFVERYRHIIEILIEMNS